MHHPLNSHLYNRSRCSTGCGGKRLWLPAQSWLNQDISLQGGERAAVVACAQVLPLSDLATLAPILQDQEAPDRALQPFVCSPVALHIPEVGVGRVEQRGTQPEAVVGGPPVLQRHVVLDGGQHDDLGRLFGERCVS